MPLKARDNCSTSETKNDALADKLKLDWNPEDIRWIKRSDTAEFKGWIAYLAGEQPEAD